MKVLYIDAIGPLGGSQISMFEAIRAMPNEALERYFVVQKGSSNALYARLAHKMFAVRGLPRFDNTWYSYYRGARWLLLIREMAYVPFILVALLRAKRHIGQIDLIHAAEVTDIVSGLFAKAIFKVPLLVHVRSLQRMKMGGLRNWLLRYMLSRHVDALVAIDENVRATLPDSLNVEVIHNSFTPKISERRDESIQHRIRELDKESLKVGFVGNLQRMKGIGELLKAAEIVLSRGVNADFLIVGGGVSAPPDLKRRVLDFFGFNQDVSRQIEQDLRSSPAAARFHLLGSTWDISNVLPQFDVLVFPSHLDAPGRPVFEAAFFAVPSIVAVKVPQPDTLRPNVTAVTIEGPDPVLIANAVQYCAENRHAVLEMGRNAKKLAEENFVPQRNAVKLCSLYRRLAARQHERREGGAEGLGGVNFPR